MFNNESTHAQAQNKVHTQKYIILIFHEEINLGNYDYAVYFAESKLALE